MAVILLIFLSVIFVGAVLFVTQSLLEEKRTLKNNALLLFLGLILSFVFSVLTESVITAGRPTFYYHLHKPGMATLKLFGASCLFTASFFALFLMAAERKKQKNSVFRWLFRALVMGICGAFILEVGFFNFRHFELIGAKAPTVNYSGDRIYCAGMYFNRAAWKFIPYEWDSNPEFFVYANYSKIRNAAFEFDENDSLNLVEFKFDDRAHRRMESIGEHRFIPGIPRSFIVPLHTVGVTNTISMTVLDDKKDWDEGVALQAVTLNLIVPLELDPVRFSLCFLVIFLFSAFFPGSPLWVLPLDLHCFYQIGAVLALLFMTILFFGWCVFSSYTGSRLSINEQKAALTENYQQYDKLVEALEAHRYSLLEIPHHYLEKDGDPYDMKLREERQFDYLWDTAYYNGQYYVYFGVVPAVSVLLPYKLLTGENLPLDYPILGFSILFLIGLYGVYSVIVRRYFPKISFGLYWIGLFLLLTSLNLTWCLRRTLVYELAITSGICFAVWGIFFMLLAAGSNRWCPISLLLSGTCAALAVGCRPTMIFVSLPVIVPGLFMLKNDSKKNRLLNGVIFLLPYLLVGAALMKYNFERFDDPFEFGITYQLTTENRAAGLPLLGPSGRMLSILSSLFTFPRVDLVFPFVHPQKPELPYNGVILNSDTLIGVFSYPLMFVLFMLPYTRKRMKNKGWFLYLFCGSCVISALCICITDSAFAITNRYLTDYLFLLGLTSVFSLFCVWEDPETLKGQIALEWGLLICAAAGMAIFVCLSLTGEEGWFRLINPLYYEKLRYAFSPWL